MADRKKAFCLPPLLSLRDPVKQAAAVLRIFPFRSQSGIVRLPADITIFPCVEVKRDEFFKQRGYPAGNVICILIRFPFPAVVDDDTGCQHDHVDCKQRDQFCDQPEALQVCVLQDLCGS